MDKKAGKQLGFSSKRLKLIDKTMQRYVDEGKLAGMVTLLARRGQIVQQGCYGMADKEAGKAMQADSLFRIWSMTKAVTAVAALILYEEGHYILDQDITEFLPEFKATKVYVKGTGDKMTLTEPERPITIRQLMTHTAGLFGGGGDHPVEKLVQEKEKEMSQGIPTLAQVIEAIAGVPLLYQPFTRWSYSVGLDVLARIIEVVSGQYFDVFLKERIFEPLGMKDTGFVVKDKQIDRFTALYRTDEEGHLALAEAPKDSLDYQWRDKESGTYFTPGGSGLVSSVLDYNEFAQMLLNKGELNGARILSPHTVTLMARNHLPAHLLPYHFNNAQPMYGYGHGLGVHTLMDRGLAGTPCADGEFWKDGGAGTLFWVDPKHDLVGLVFYQLLEFWIYPIFAKFRATAYQAMLD